MNSIKKMFDILSEPLGIKTRTFVADYRDSENNYFNEEFNSIAVEDDDYIAKNIIAEIEALGYVVYSVYEILNDYSLCELEEVINHNLKEVHNYARLIYIDLSKEFA